VDQTVPVLKDYKDSEHQSLRVSESQSSLISTTTTMPANKVLANNARIMARTEKSVSAERNFYKTKKEEQMLKNTRSYEYEESVTAKSNQYAEYWIYEKGDRAKLVINAYFNNKSSNDPCFINVYDKKEKTMKKYNFFMVVEMIFKEVHDLPGNRLGQTRIWGDMYLSTEIYKFMNAHWNDLNKESSEC
tara:strand:- start:198 stop:764 length:567 start_codon:yes stop_codon:yes gene_type:complete